MARYTFATIILDIGDPRTRGILFIVVALAV